MASLTWRCLWKFTLSMMTLFTDRRWGTNRVCTKLIKFIWSVAHSSYIGVIISTRAVAPMIELFLPRLWGLAACTRWPLYRFADSVKHITPWAQCPAWPWLGVLSAPGPIRPKFPVYPDVASAPCRFHYHKGSNPPWLLTLIPKISVIFSYIPFPSRHVSAI